MRQVAEGVWMLRGFPPNGINVYVVGGELDADAMESGDMSNPASTRIPGLSEPKARFTPDPVQNRASIRRLAMLEPKLVLFGHGAPLRQPEKLAAFVRRLPRD